MCFHLQISKDSQKIASRFKLKNNSDAEAGYKVAFSNPRPQLAIIKQESQDELNTSNWGFIPNWSSSDFIKKLKVGGGYLTTENAKLEGLFGLDGTKQTKMFTKSVDTKKCLIPATSSYEWQHEQPGVKGTKKTKYEITIPEDDIFFFLGLYDSWTNKSTGEIWEGFTIVTQRAGEVMSEIHNSKLRQPVTVNYNQGIDLLNTPKSDLVESVLSLQERVFIAREI